MVHIVTDEIRKEEAEVLTDIIKRELCCKPVYYKVDYLITIDDLIKLLDIRLKVISTQLMNVNDMPENEYLCGLREDLNSIKCNITQTIKMLKRIPD